MRVVVGWLCLLVGGVRGDGGGIIRICHIPLSRLNDSTLVWERRDVCIVSKDMISLLLLEELEQK